MQISFDDKMLMVDGRKISFEAKISEVVRYDGNIIIVLLDYYEAKDYRNVFAVENSGQILWQVEDVFGQIEGGCPFSGVASVSPDLSIYNWCGFKCKINPLTGKVLETLFTK